MSRRRFSLINQNASVDLSGYLTAASTPVTITGRWTFDQELETASVFATGIGSNPTGSALRIAYSSGIGYLDSRNFGAASYTPLVIRSSDLTIESDVTIDSDTGWALTLEGTAPKLKLHETDATANEGEWDIVAASDSLLFRTIGDGDSSSNTYMTVSRSGTTPTISVSPSTLNLNPSGNLNINPGGNCQLLEGNKYRVFDSTSVYYNDVYVAANAKDPARLVYFGDSSDGGSFRCQKITIADDATKTLAVGSYAICFLLSTYNRQAFAHFGITTTQAPQDFGSGPLISMGSANPDVDGDVNIWPSASGELSIKNRLGSSRSFYLFTLEL
jgi:hypothetical protein